MSRKAIMERGGWLWFAKTMSGARVIIGIILRETNQISSPTFIRSISPLALLLDRLSYVENQRYRVFTFSQRFIRVNFISLLFIAKIVKLIFPNMGPFSHLHTL